MTCLNSGFIDHTFFPVEPETQIEGQSSPGVGIIYVEAVAVSLAVLVSFSGHFGKKGLSIPVIFIYILGKGRVISGRCQTVLNTELKLVIAAQQIFNKVVAVDFGTMTRPLVFFVAVRARRHAGKVIIACLDIHSSLRDKFHKHGAYGKLQGEKKIVRESVGVFQFDESAICSLIPACLRGTEWTNSKSVLSFFKIIYVQISPVILVDLEVELGVVSHNFCFIRITIDGEAADILDSVTDPEPELIFF